MYHSDRLRGWTWSTTADEVQRIGFLRVLARPLEQKSRNLSARSFVVVSGNYLIEVGVGGALLAGDALVDTGTPLRSRVLPNWAIELGNIDVLN